MRLNDENSIWPDPEMILARHESQNYIPHNYPNWDEKMWAKIWRSHERWIKRREIEKVEERKEFERIMREKQQAVQGLLSILSNQVLPLAQKRAEEKKKEWLMEQKWLSVKKSGNAKQAMALTQSSRETLLVMAKSWQEWRDSVIYLLYMTRIWLKWATKKARKNSENLITFFEWILKEVWVPTDKANIDSVVKGLPENIKRNFNKQIR